ncbi:hypothetical protein AA0522_1773 [Gluconacetobacter liquefaciens NRIC 0522]|nr:hypothetical protein AA0522_1773 [Gluconacetobacter liquefaciens NRIC 0522]
MTPSFHRSGGAIALAAALCLTSSLGHAAPPPPATPAAASSLTVQTGSDIPAHVTFPTAARDYVKREVMIPMRDGVKLHTVIVIPRDAHDAPILLTRTPYHASQRLNRVEDALTMRALLPQGDDVFVESGYIRVFQDIRGKYGSEGDYVMTRPVRGPLNPTNTDEVTDAWDTIDWLVHNLPQSNGRVGMLGSSYEGFTVVMALLNPHPALKVAAPESPMVDGWMGDDWYHYGAFRQGGAGLFHRPDDGAGLGLFHSAGRSRRLYELPARGLCRAVRLRRRAGPVSLVAAHAGPPGL